MHSSLIAWIMRAIPFGTIIMYGALGETVTEKIRQPQPRRAGHHVSGRLCGLCQRLGV